MSGRLLVFGMGYSARRLARRLRAEGWEVAGTVRRPEAAGDLEACGIVPLVWPGADAGPAIARASHVLCSVPPGPEGDPVVAALGATLAQARHLAMVGYLSTTGVYGDHRGGWVDEDTPTAPGSARAAARVTAEAAWAELCAAAGVPLTVFRLAGIYGPGRSPFGRLRDGTARAIVKPGQVFSRIHVDDIAQALAAALARPGAVDVVNLADDLPAPPEEVLWHAADLAGLPRPPAEPWEDADLSPMARSFYAESRRVRNTRLTSALGVRLIHPDYRSGLAATLAEETGGAG
ncbi:MAG: NAD-dependent epimerase/dehydratase family protein [Alkalilacustris sp.]